MKKMIIATAVIVVGIVGIMSLGNDEAAPASGGSANNVTMQNGTQVVTITAKGGYRPRVTEAKAGIPTVFKVVTNNTYDCSSAFTIPALRYRKNLPPSGETLVTIPAQAAGSTIEGLCSMGMYNFTVRFN